LQLQFASQNVLGTVTSQFV